MPPPMIRLSGTRRGFFTSIFAGSRWLAVTVVPLLTPGPQGVPDSGVQQGVGEVGQHVGHAVGGSDDEHAGLQHRQVALLDREQHEAAEPRIAEHLLDQHHSAQHPADVEGDDGDGGQQGVAQRVLEQHELPGQALELRGAHVGCLQHLDHRRPGDAGDVGQGLDGEHRDRHGQHVGPVEEPLALAERCGGGEPAEPRREDQDEQRAGDEGRHRHSGQGAYGDRGVDPAVGADRGDDPEHQAQHHRNEERRDREAEREEQPLHHDGGDGRVHGEAAAEVAAHRVPQPAEVLLVPGPIESELPAQGLELLAGVRRPVQEQDVDRVPRKDLEDDEDEQRDTDQGDGQQPQPEDQVSKHGLKFLTAAGGSSLYGHTRAGWIPAFAGMTSGAAPQAARITVSAFTENDGEYGGRQNRHCAKTE